MALDAYKNRENLLRCYSPKTFHSISEYDAIMGNSPTLAVMNSTFGQMTAEVIIAAMLCDLNQYTNARVKITPEQADMMATIIVADPELKGIRGDVLMMFFSRLKTGAFGELYNIVDAVSIASKLRQFYRECEAKRIAWADNLEEERKDQERKKWANDALKPEEINELRKKLQQEGKI